MTNSQNVANFDPPQNNSQAIKINLPGDSKQTYFANLCLQGNDSKKNDLKQGKNEAKKDPLQGGNEKVTFWTACSYCYYKYEYEKKFEESCLRCQNCRKAFHAAAVVKGHSGNNSMSQKKKIRRRNTAKSHDAVEISDSDDENKERVIKRVKSVARTRKKIAGRGVETKKVENEDELELFEGVNDVFVDSMDIR